MVSRSRTAGDVLALVRKDPAMRARMKAVAEATPTKLVLVHDGVVHQDRMETPGAPWKRYIERGTALAWLASRPTVLHALRAARCVIVTGTDQAPLLPEIVRAKDGVRRAVVYVAGDDVNLGRHAAIRLEREARIVAVSTKVVAVSEKLADLLAARHGFPRSDVLVSRNAVARDLVPDVVPAAPAPLPAGLPASFQRPVVGVLGTISSRLRLDWIRAALDNVPELRWLFVGNVEEYELAIEDRAVLRDLVRHPRCAFVGPVSHRTLSEYARAVDLAAMPYSGTSVNPVGSPTRLFLQLPYGQPIVASDSCAQFDEFRDVVRVESDVAGFVRALRELVGASFDDGLREARWRLARRHTWTERARPIAEMIDALVA
ncbi:MAG: hypothetical protein U0169_23895 [Polyangiaceae bacterium]